MNKFKVAMATSLTAGLMIMAVLVLIAIVPLSSLFQFPLILLLVVLWVLGVVAYRMLSSARLNSSSYIHRYTPYSLALTLMFIVAGVMHRWVAMGVLLIAGYSFELVAGFILYNDFKAITGRGNALMFLVGISLFILSLPLAIMRIPWPAVVGVLLKTISIARVIRSPRPSPPIRQTPRLAT